MDFKFKKINSNTGEYIEITDFKPDVLTVEIPCTIDNIPIKEISQTALVRNQHIHCFILPYREDDFSLAKFILNNTSQSLRIIFGVENVGFELAFPGYNDRAVEDTMARAIHFKIDGSGYAYRECVFRDHIDFVGYDSIFDRGREEIGVTPIDIALGRLMSGFRLEDVFKEKYEKFVYDNMLRVVDYLIESKDKNRLSFLLKNLNIDKDTIGYALKKTSTLNLFELTSVIMENSLK